MMKKWLLIFIVLFLASCKNGAVEAEEAHIKRRILLQNNAFLPYLIDSINKRTDLRAKILYLRKGEARADEFSDSVLSILYKDKNIPYKLEADPHLTYEKFMAYCLQLHLDPVKTANKLREK